MAGRPGPELGVETEEEAHRGDSHEIPPSPPLAQGEYDVPQNPASL